MSHLMILCEGHLEEKVLESFLQIYWQKRFKTVEVQRYNGNGELAKNFKADTETQLTAEPTSSVLCLVDLYKEPFGNYRADLSVKENFILVQLSMYNKVQSHFHSRFGAFPVVMEIETWLLASPKLQKRFQRQYKNPEEEIPHPARELERIYEARNSSYDKISTGTELFRQISAKEVYDDHCDHFKLMIDWITNPPQDKKKEQITEREQRWYAQLAELEARIEALWQQFEASEDPAIEEQLKAAENERDRFSQTYTDLFKN